MFIRSRVKSLKGTTITELIVAATLVVTMIGIVSPLAFKTTRMWQETRHYRLALDELSNQMELCLQADPVARAKMVADLKPSLIAQAVLESAILSGTTVSDQDGERVVMTIQWDRTPSSPPLQLIGWITPPVNSISISKEDAK